MAQSLLTRFRMHICLTSRLGGRVWVPTRWFSAFSKPLQWQLISGLCSVLMRDERHCHMSGIPRPASSLDLAFPVFFLWDLARICNKESPTHDTGVEVCYSGWNCDNKSQLLCRVLDNFVNRLRLHGICFKRRTPHSKPYLSKVINGNSFFYIKPTRLRRTVACKVKYYSVSRLCTILYFLFFSVPLRVSFLVMGKK